MLAILYFHIPNPLILNQLLELTMSSLITFLAYEVAVLFFAIWGVTHPEIQSLRYAKTEAQMVIFLLDAFMAIGGMCAFINSWTKD